MASKAYTSRKKRRRLIKRMDRAFLEPPKAPFYYSYDTSQVDWSVGTVTEVLEDGVVRVRLDDKRLP